MSRGFLQKCNLNQILEYFLFKSNKYGISNNLISLLLDDGFYGIQISNRSRFITLLHADAKSVMNFSFASLLA